MMSNDSQNINPSDSWDLRGAVSSKMASAYKLELLLREVLDGHGKEKEGQQWRRGEGRKSREADKKGTDKGTCVLQRRRGESRTFGMLDFPVFKPLHHAGEV